MLREIRLRKRLLLLPKVERREVAEVNFRGPLENRHLNDLRERCKWGGRRGREGRETYEAYQI